MKIYKKDISSLQLDLDNNQKFISGLNIELKSRYSEQNQVNIDDIRRDLNYVQTSIAVNQRAMNELGKRITEKNSLVQNNSIALENIKIKLLQCKQSIQEIENAKKDRKMDEEQKNLVLEQLTAKIEPAEIRLK